MMVKTILLLVNPLIEHALQLTDLLSDQYTIIHAKDEMDAIQIVRKKAVSVILTADVSCSNLKQLFAFLKKHEADQKIPILVIGHLPDEEISALNYGAWDFITQPFQECVLFLRII